jgi:fatty-acyl-CoA synthase/long-chain acyl-CoA synthetase
MDPLERTAIDDPTRPAVIDDRPDGSVRRICYGALDVYVNRLANGLLALGLEPLVDKVAWCGKNSIDTIAITHATRRAGLIAVPLNYRLTVDELTYLVANSDARALWIDAEMAPTFAEVAARIGRALSIVVFDGPPLAGQLAVADVLAWSSPPAVELPPEGVAIMIYTSGTTGRPKGALRRGNGDPRQREAMMKAIGFARGDVYITTGPLYHSGPNNFAMIHMGLGNTVIVQRHFDAEDWLRLFDRYRVTSTFSAPTPVRRILDLPADVRRRYDVSSMRIMLANAAPWPFALKRRYLEYFPERSLWEGYGATEIGITTLLRPEDQLRKPGSCGQAAPFVDIVLIDEHGNVVREPGVPGELYVRASSVVEGYYKDQALFDAEQRGEYHTVGDVATFDDEGYYYICDRRKDMIISGGVNIYPAEIESALEAHPGVFEAAVIGVPDDEWGESVRAFVIRRDPSLTEEALAGHARGHLAGFKVPRSVVFVEALPRTGSGKVLKRELRTWSDNPARPSHSSIPISSAAIRNA